MIYVKVNPANIIGLNRSIQRLMRPSHLRDEHYVTDLYCPILTHPVDGRTCLELPESETVPIHIDADGAELQAMFAIFVADGSITQAEADGIAAAVQANAGQEVMIAGFIPPSWQSNVYTREQLEADGWFPDQEII